MRSWWSCIAGAALALAPAVAGALPIVELIWVATSGAGQPGASAIAAAAGDVLTGEIRVRGDVGISSYGLSVEFDVDLGDELDVLSTIELTPPGFALSFTPGVAAVQESSAALRGRVLTFEAATLGLGPSSFVAGRIAFVVGADVASDGADLFLGLFHDGVDGLFDDDGTDLSQAAEYRTAAVNVIPEAETGLLLAAGIAGLAAAARR